LPSLALLDTEKSVIRNSRWRCDHGWDIDLDDGSSYYHIYNNLCLNGGIKLREGFHRVVDNNIMVNNSFHPHAWYENSQDIFRKNIVFGPYKPYIVPTPWGKQCDYNLLHNPDLVGTRPATNLQQQSKRDRNSIIANAMFIDPENGDYRVADDSPAIQLGFKNFPMDQFGVQKAELKAIARTPILPVVKKPVAESVNNVVSYWQGATVKGLSGEEYSAFGVGKEEGGVHLIHVPAETLAANAGFRTNDLIQTVNGQSIKTVADLQRATDLAGGKALTIGYVRREHGSGIITMKRYVYTVTESTETQF
jgi:hypothetical protein